MKFKDLLDILKKNKILMVIAIIVAIFIIIRYTNQVKDDYYIDDEPNGLERVEAVGLTPERVPLPQAWPDTLRQQYWYTSQGSGIIPYKWFVHLEQSNNQNPFRSGDLMDQMGYLPSPSSKLNPGGLPIGFAAQRARKNKEPWMGFNCAACHTNQIDYQGTKMMVEGAPTLANFAMIYTSLINSVIATQADPAKLNRFVDNVLDAGYSESDKAELGKQMTKWVKAANDRQDVNALPSPEFPADFASYGRVDAFGQIANAGTAFGLHNLQNNNPPSAPVSYPFLWGTHQSDVVQWNASAPNIPVVGPLVRNVGEVVGVFGDLSIHSSPWWQNLIGVPVAYSSTVDYQGIGDIEAWVKELRSPQWPETILPPLDQAKVRQGAILFNTVTDGYSCANCHQVISRDNEDETYFANRTPLIEIGTDPMMAFNAGRGEAKTLILEGTKKYLVAGEELSATAGATSIVVNGILGVILKRPQKALEAGRAPEKVGHKENAIKYVLKLKKKKEEDEAKYQTPHDTLHAPNALGPNVSPGGNDLDGLVYKGRPLNGIWATAPFLHNGSVPNLWELLQKPEDRMTHFQVGNREYDPVNVGFVTEGGPSEFRVLRPDSTIMPGNSNLGHHYGMDFSDDQKWALIEYMKSL